MLSWLIIAIKSFLEKFSEREPMHLMKMWLKLLNHVLNTSKMGFNQAMLKRYFESNIDLNETKPQFNWG